MKKSAYLKVCLFIAGFVFIQSHAVFGMGITPFGKLALEESLIPVCQGDNGPFWNGYSKRFIYPPAFDFNTIVGAAKYRFTAKSGSSDIFSFEATMPIVALSPIWKQLPVGSVSLKVEAVDKKGNVIGQAGVRDFIKSPAFNGPYSASKYDYYDSGRRCLGAVLCQPKLQLWLKTGLPDPNYTLYIYPCKTMGAVAAAMAHYSLLRPRPNDANEALKIACTAADFMISLSPPKGQPLEYWPPTYWSGVDRKFRVADPNVTLSCYPAEAAMALLDLYDATKEQKYLDTAKRIADTYVKLQRPDGTWFRFIKVSDGKAASPNLLNPPFVINFFNRLEQRYNIKNYKTACDKAFKWLMDNPVKTFNWQGQFEDLLEMLEPYSGLSREEATETAVILLDHAKEKPEYVGIAQSLLRFAEDQFVVWEARDQIAGESWILPAVLEQYTGTYLPISGSNRSMVLAYLKAYEVTGNKLYHAKAVALANTLIIAKNIYGGDEIPTYIYTKLPGENWLNCSIYPAIMLIECNEKLKNE